MKYRVQSRRLGASPSILHPRMLGPGPSLQINSITFDHLVGRTPGVRRMTLLQYPNDLAKSILIIDCLAALWLW